ncbi:MAG: hypothetical protein AAFY75_08040 [Pseudomonadota bacterium]
MFGTNNTELRGRIAKCLNDRGIVSLAAGPVEHTQDEVQDSFLSHLFDFPHLDFAFVRYPSEMVVVDWDGRLEVFGVCDAGLIALDANGAILLIDEEEERSILAGDPMSFVNRYHAMVRGALATTKADRAQAADQIAQGEDAGFWAEQAYAVEDGFATARRHILAALKDGAVKSLV